MLYKKLHFLQFNNELKNSHILLTEKLFDVLMLRASTGSHLGRAKDTLVENVSARSDTSTARYIDSYKFIQQFFCKAM